MKTKRNSKLKRILVATEKQMQTAISAGAKEASRVMNRLVAVDEGDLKSTIELEDEGEGRATVSVGGKSKISDKIVDYVKPVEFGSTHKAENGETYHIDAQPFFRPGRDAGRRKMKSKMKIAGIRK